MSFPDFPSRPKAPQPSHSSPIPSPSSLPSHGAGDHLPVWLLVLCGVLTALATGISIMSITLQLKNYRRPSLQRAVVRIMIMVPLYAISSLIALFSLEAAFFIDAVRDLYEAFVIYTFLQLLITYLGGERSLLIILHGRPPIPHPFPFSLFLKPMDVSDPWVLLNLKRGVLQYVQIKPLLVVATVILKATGTYRDGDFAVDSGYTYISIVYNTSICLSLYCLAMFWVCVSVDLKPFRPVPKFLCVKGILFFSFWQSIGISLLVAVHAIKKVGPYTDAEHMSLALVDSLICFEMPIFAVAHQYAFQASDYIDHSLVYAARLPFIYALRDAFGLKDVWEDSKDTIKGRGVSYQAYEPAEGGLHYGLGRQRRIRAGLRYSKGGKAKYWIPIPGDDARGRGETGPLSAIKRKVDERLAAREGYAPLLPEQASRVVHEDPNLHHHHNEGSSGLLDSDSDESDAPSLRFNSIEDDYEWENGMYERARRIGYAGFPNVDVSREEAKRRRWEEEEAILAGNRGDRPGFGRKGSKEKRGRKGNSPPTKSVYGDGNESQPKRKSKLPGRAASATGEGTWLTAKQDRTDAQASASATPSPSPSPEDSPPTKPTSPFSIGDDIDDPDTDDEVKPTDRPLPSDARDLVVQDNDAEEQARMRERRKGEPQRNSGAQVFKKNIIDSEGEQIGVERQEGGGGLEGEGDPTLAVNGDRAVEITPPAHVLTLTQDDDNPWA